MIQSFVEALIKLGPLPSAKHATVPKLQEIEKIQSPISDDDARVLLTMFGPDDCFGLAWSLIHLIETSPGWPIEDALNSFRGEWIELLKERAAKAIRTE